MSGMVVAAETQRPLSGAQVVLQAAPLGVLTPGTGPRPLLLGEGLAVSTDSSGAYRFSNLPAGRYRIYVHALGYRPAMLEVRLSGHETSQLSVGLRVATVALEPVVVIAERGEPFGAPGDPGAVDGLAGRMERLRQARYLTSDARAVTRADVQQAVTLGESDLFRALERLPGVSTRDDYTTELWTRGAPWGQTAVYFDGIPLFNPLHAAGAVSAVNVDAVGAVFFHPGVQPAELASGAAGLIDIRSRRGAVGPGGASAELSLLSGRVTADGQWGESGRGGWMLALRRSHLDLLARGVRAAGGDSAGFPYAFADAVGRVDFHLGGSRRLEVSGLYETDRLDGEIRGVVQRSTAQWGSVAGQVTLVLPLLGGESYHTAAVSRFAARGGGSDSVPARFPRGGDPVEGPYRVPPLRNEVSYLSLSGRWEAPRPYRGVDLSAGYRLVAQEAGFRTRGLWSYRTIGDEAVESAQHLRYGVLWAAGEKTLSPGVRMEAGARAELGDAVANAGRLRLAPRIAVRYEPAPGLGVSAAASRSYQYAQALVPPGPGYDGVAVSSLFWMLAGDTIPALRSDLYTVGVEQWFGEGVLASATAYRREVDGVAVPDPTEGWLADRALSVPARNQAYGGELSLRRLVGRWTGSAGYAYGTSELEAKGVRFPAPTGRKHTLDVSAMAKLGGSFRAGAAYTVATGVRFTRYEGVLQDCEGSGGDGCRYATYAREPGGEQAPAYRSLDLLAEWNGRLGSWQVGAYAQLRNVLGRANVGAYRSSVVFCAKSPGQSCHPILEADPDSFLPEMNRFLPGLPFVPFVGVRVTM